MKELNKWGFYDFSKNNTNMFKMIFLYLLTTWDAVIRNKHLLFSPSRLWKFLIVKNISFLTLSPLQQSQQINHCPSSSDKALLCCCYCVVILMAFRQQIINYFQDDILFRPDHSFSFRNFAKNFMCRNSATAGCCTCPWTTFPASNDLLSAIYIPGSIAPYSFTMETG